MSIAPYYSPPIFNGVEVDVLSLGDADSIIVTRWVNSFPHRVLIDGGSGINAPVVLNFLLRRGWTNLWAVVCTHPHNDHAAGLAKLVRSSLLTISNGWMHDITKHVSAESLRRSSAASDGVKEVVENTKELAAAFASRGITPMEPFAGMTIAAWPEMQVLGPSLPYYREVIAEFTKVKVAIPLPLPASSSRVPLSSLAGLAGIPSPGYNSLASLIPPIPSKPALTIPPPLMGVLSKSSVLKNPTTQPFNNTSVILGVNMNGTKLLFTADAGAEALSYVGPEWNHLKHLGVPHHGSEGNLSQSDIERFKPDFAVISAKGDSSHPSRAIVSGLVKVGATVASTHKSGNLWTWFGCVPARADYGPVEPLRGTGEPEPVLDWMKYLLDGGK